MAETFSPSPPIHLNPSVLTDWPTKSPNQELWPVTGIETIAKELIDRDEAELQEKFGQNIREAFPSSDFFVDADSSKLQQQITRIVN